MLTDEKRRELTQRRDAAQALEEAQNVDWDGVDAYIDYAMTLVRPGGVMSVVLPDGRPFTAVKPKEQPADGH